MTQEDYEEPKEQESVYDHAIYASPWRERYPPSDDTGRPRYGPWYLPTSPVSKAPVAQSRAEMEYASGRYAFSPGLWDYEEDSRMRGLHVGVKKMLERYDFALVRNYVERYSSRIGRRMLEVYTAFWVEGRSVANTATHLGISRNAARHAIKDLRRRVNKQ